MAGSGGRTLRSSSPAKSAFAEIASLAGKEDLNYNWALIMRAHAFLALTDKYGPMPFGLDATNLEGYNSQEAIYKALVADLDAAASNINAFVLANPGRTVNEAADKIYSGDFSKWGQARSLAQAPYSYPYALCSSCSGSAVRY